MSADKSLLQLEKNVRRHTTTISVPMSTAYQGDAEKAVAESKKQAIPSAPVPLPTEHSPLFLMKEEARNRFLGRGQRLPEKPLDRRVGNEGENRLEDTPSGIAVEFVITRVAVKFVVALVAFERVLAFSRHNHVVAFAAD